MSDHLDPICAGTIFSGLDRPFFPHSVPWKHSGKDKNLEGEHLWIVCRKSFKTKSNQGLKKAGRPLLNDMYQGRSKGMYNLRLGVFEFHVARNQSVIKSKQDDRAAVAARRRTLAGQTAHRTRTDRDHVLCRYYRCRARAVGTRHSAVSVLREHGSLEGSELHHPGAVHCTRTGGTGVK